MLVATTAQLHPSGNSLISFVLSEREIAITCQMYADLASRLRAGDDEADRVFVGFSAIGWLRIRWAGLELFPQAWLAERNFPRDPYEPPEETPPDADTGGEPGHYQQVSLWQFGLDFSEVAVFSGGEGVVSCWLYPDTWLDLEFSETEVAVLTNGTLSIVVPRRRLQDEAARAVNALRELLASGCPQLANDDFLLRALGLRGAEGDHRV